MKSPVLFLAAILIFAGCGAPNVALFDTTHRPPTTGVEIFHEGQRPDRPYKEIGELSQEYFTGEDAVVLSNFAKKARAAGADAVLVLPGRDVGYQWNPFGRSGNRYVLRASLIIWTTASKSLGTHSGA